ncbi:MAG: hypothetical protein H6645_01485 [Caldilineaceae bacterium]|nr:hypothetical protein [Caldilineaceae bacterium]MCB9155774.1 hypothetical protein [Caldilineaceae bacterium]
METTILFFSGIAIIAYLINIALTIYTLGRNSETTSDDARSALDAYYQYYTCIGY